MSADVIKDYLVGLGFNVDLGSLSKMKNSLKDAEKSVNEMSESNSKAITKVKDSIEDFKEDSKSQEWGFKPIEENSNPLLKLKEKINKSSEDIKKTLGDTANKSKKLIDKVGKDVKPNDIQKILDVGIMRIFCNGAKAYSLYYKYIYPKTQTEAVRLPSTSPANASYSLEKLISEWKIITRGV